MVPWGAVTSWQVLRCCYELALLFEDFLSFLEAPHDGIIIRRHLGVQLGVVLIVRAISVALEFADHRISTGRNDSGLREVSEGDSGREFARVF